MLGKAQAQLVLQSLFWGQKYNMMNTKTACKFIMRKVTKRFEDFEFFLSITTTKDKVVEALMNTIISCKFIMRQVTKKFEEFETDMDTMSG